MEKENPYLNVYLGSLKKPWADYCASIGKKPGAALKEAIEKQLESSDALPEPKTYSQTKPTPEKEPKIRFEILLTPSEKAALTERAEVERCSQRRWVVDAIRAGLTNEAQFGMSEIEALGESNYQLLAIGRNLNQIARKLNEGDPYPIQKELIKGLSAIIDRHTHVVSSAIRASLERWDLE
ncbi:plasmid mobilization relaxosome protein MobC [Pseudomonas syringae]|uniref:plasmid mobilization relaxosome protein MobC n=1 Tax=Pseudomonas syringae TaxID=317 RepID=UPI0023F6BBF7|nr:plasmid mobilization relaxosome protein MobC [Pseudomonas syringae]MDF5835096.1 plasmid mobilization relaxosome protein MobC [Pseudomonas syringae]